MLPLLIPEGKLLFKNGDYLFLPGIRQAVKEKSDEIQVYRVSDKMESFTAAMGELTDDEREIILQGCLINYNRR